jgi:molybdenum cofactor sulfurtransferase
MDKDWPGTQTLFAAAGVMPGGGLSALETETPDFEATRSLDRLRETDFSRVDRQGHVYLDWTGGGLYADRLVRRHTDLLRSSVLGNPHSSNPTSRTSTVLVESCRRRVLSFFNASPDEYVAIFTANASHALKLVGESYPFEPGDELLLTFDNHNSVNGIREFDRAHGAHTTYVPVIPPEMRGDEAALSRALDRARPGRHNLFAYPAQSNFSGVQHPLEWIAQAQDRGWDVLLDAAAFVPTNRLDLSRWHPDYVALSFYKMFGYPTGVGALLVRRPALAKLHRPWFAGGTIAVASVQADRHSLAAGAAGFEDGTPSYACLPAVEIGLDLLETLGIETIHRRVRWLTGWLLERLLALRHGNGQPLIVLYGPRTTARRGGTFAFNVRTAEGALLDHQEIEERAGRRGISLRTGCFCNPGAGELALGLSRDEIETCFRRTSDPMTYEDFRRCIDGKSSGAVRVSLGMVTNLADLEAFLGFLEELREG